MVDLRRLLELECDFSYVVGQFADEGYLCLVLLDGEQILRVDWTGTATSIYSEPGSTYEDIVVGPGGYLYACDPENGVITKIDPTNGFNPEINI